MKNRLKILLISVLGIVILISGFSFSNLRFSPLKANAAVPTITVVDTPRTGEKIWTLLKKALFSTLKKQIIGQIVDQTVAWIQGTGGKPRFVTDWRGFIKDAVSAGIGNAIADDPSLSFLCSPFRAQLLLNLPLVPIPKFSEEARCTLDQIRLNVRNFARDFREGAQGGTWIGFQSMWEPKNNFLAASIIGEHAIYTSQAESENAAQNQAVSGGGFLGVDKNGKIITPGSVVGGEIQKALGSDFDFIVNAQDIGEISGALVNAAFNRVMRGGAKGLAEATVPDEATRQATQDRLDSDFNRIVEQDLRDTRNFYVSELSTIISPRDAANNTINTSVSEIERFQDITSYTLPQCPPYQTPTPQVQAQAIILNTLDSLKQQKLSGTDADITVNNLNVLKEQNNVLARPFVTAQNNLTTIYNDTTITPQIKQNRIASAFNEVSDQINATNQDVANSFLTARQTDLTTIRGKISIGKTQISEIHCPVLF